jgi:type IV pilus assembly protein PilZ
MMATIGKNSERALASSTSDDGGPSSQRDDRRSYDRFDVEWSVDCIADDTFLFASITNISAMGIFVKTIDPKPVGTRMTLTFEPPGYEPFKLDGTVAWINHVRADGDNPNPGMGVRFVNLRPEDRERLVEVIRTIAYVRDPS